MTRYLTELDTAIAELQALRRKARRADKKGRTALTRIVEALAGQPKAVATDGTGRGGGVIWCWHHEQDVRTCHQNEQTDPTGNQCKGEPSSGHADPTGSAGVIRYEGKDRAANDLRQLERNVRTIRNVVDLSVVIIDNWAARPASRHERQRMAWANKPACESCSRVASPHIAGPWLVEPRNAERTTVPNKDTGEDRLAKPLYLCRWCEDHVLDHGCIPNEAEVTQHRDGKRIVCPHPKAIDVQATNA